MNARTVTFAGIAATAIVLIGAIGSLRWVSAAQSLGDANCDGTVNSIDATLILQLNAGLLQSVPCEGKADTNADGRVDSLDAALILQFTAGLLDGLGLVETPSPLSTSTPVGTPKPLPTSTPATAAGVYTGTHAAGGTVTFEVNDYGSRILRFSTATEKVLGCRKNFFVVGAYIRISGSYFSYDHYGQFSFTGVLDGSGSASGTLSHEACRLVNVPWTATR